METTPQSMTRAFERELEKFDRERVQPAWDSLVFRQQKAMESLGVPLMFVTDNPPERQVRLFSNLFFLLELIVLLCSANKGLST